MCSLPSSVIITSGPRCYWPAVVNLPKQCAPTVTFLAAMRFDSCLHSIALHQLAYIQQRFEILRTFILTEQIRLYQLIGMHTATLVRHHNIRIDIPVVGLWCKLFDRLKLRETLHTVFATETETCIIILRDGFLSMPYCPIVIIARCFYATMTIATKRR